MLLCISEKFKTRIIPKTTLKTNFIIMIDRDKLVERFIRYVKIDTESDPNSDTTPSTKKQWDLANLLVKELKEMGMQEVSIDENAYVMATLPSNVSHETPTIGFISHFDTSPDFTGKGVNPQIVENYDGKDILLNKEQNIVLSPKEFEDLLLYKGQTLITTDGTTLLGADDKAGIAEIMAAVEHLIKNPDIPHGTIRVGFTPDEEIGRGAHKFDVEKFDADWAYTMDGSQIGQLEYESFNAAGAVVKIQGKIVHPGYAKDKMVNSIFIAQKFIDALPKKERPEHTEDREGFFHLNQIQGNVDYTELHYIIRDHDKMIFEARKQQMLDAVKTINKEIGSDRITVEINDQYFNMGEKIEPVMHIVDLAKEAMQQLDIEPLIQPIRGGTDGSQLSFMGLPCPNIFAGGHNFHGRYEFVPVESMIKATEVIVNIAKLQATMNK